ncbi:hypothetical protein A6456_12570 [Paraburkholderia tropica]|nr:hypothetical protein A6456_12570 [Paraburkholderia tropica]
MAWRAACRCRALKGSSMPEPKWFATTHRHCASCGAAVERSRSVDIDEMTDPHLEKMRGRTARGGKKPE